MRIFSATARVLPAPLRRLITPEKTLPTEEELTIWLAAECFTAPTRPLRFFSKPYCLEWFLELEARRYSRRSRWLPRLLEFGKHAGEAVLVLGNGLGTDGVQYARHGARVTVYSNAPPLVEVAERNFQLRGLSYRAFTSADRRVSLPVNDCTIDVACIGNLPPDLDLPETLAEVDRVLKPGGKVVMIAPARYSVNFWKRTILFWHRWLEPPPDANTRRFSASELYQLFSNYTEVRTYKRQLRRPEVPPLWRWIPAPLLARLMGNVLVFKGFKPVTIARRADRPRGPELKKCA